jgi:hypothetical protein
MLSGLTGCLVEKPAYQPYYVVVPYTPGTDAKTSEDAARQVIERLRQQEANQAPAQANEDITELRSERVSPAGSMVRSSFSMSATNSPGRPPRQR